MSLQYALSQTMAGDGSATTGNSAKVTRIGGAEVKTGLLRRLTSRLPMVGGFGYGRAVFASADAHHFLH